MCQLTLNTPRQLPWPFIIFWGCREREVSLKCVSGWLLFQGRQKGRENESIFILHSSVILITRLLSWQWKSFQVTVIPKQEFVHCSSLISCSLRSLKFVTVDVVIRQENSGNKERDGDNELCNEWRGKELGNQGSCPWWVIQTPWTSVSSFVNWRKSEVLSTRRVLSIKCLSDRKKKNQHPLITSWGEELVLRSTEPTFNQVLCEMFICAFALSLNEVDDIVDLLYQ